MAEGQASTISSAFTTATGDIMTEFVSLLPTILGVSVVGFVIYTIYKLVKKVRKGGK